jgi:hypothetical protein
VLQILDYGRYWAEVSTENTDMCIIHDRTMSQIFTEAVLYLLVPLHLAKICGEQLRIREIEFSIMSHDQGWASGTKEGTCETSSWFEVTYMRPRQDFPYVDLSSASKYRNTEEARLSEKHRI